MKATETYLTKLLSQPSQFRIPLWQREYAWTEEDCERLIEDILSVGRRQREAVHFIGSIITLSEAGAPAGDISVHRVVDGQQRLITTNPPDARDRGISLRANRVSLRHGRRRESGSR